MSPGCTLTSGDPSKLNREHFTLDSFFVFSCAIWIPRSAGSIPAAPSVRRCEAPSEARRPQPLTRNLVLCGEPGALHGLKGDEAPVYRTSYEPAGQWVFLCVWEAPKASGCGTRVRCTACCSGRHIYYFTVYSVPLCC